MLKKPMLSLTAAMFLVCSAGLVQAQTTEAPITDDQAKAQTTPARDKADDRDFDKADDRDFDWGWLGLIGLLGLAGLTGRTRDVITARHATNVRNEPL
jgi:hypothetical protein